MVSSSSVFPVRSALVPSPSRLLFFALPLAVLLAGFVLTITARNAAENQQLLDEQKGFEKLSDSFTAEVEKTIAAHRYLILGIRGLFNGSSHVDRDEYHNYLAAVDLETRFPGANGIGWVQRVAHSDVDAFVQQVRADDSVRPGGYPDYKIKPTSQVSEHHVVTYLEPMQGNDGAFGFDFATNSDRLAALRRARDDNRMVSTKPIMLVDDLGKHRGFLLILPVYDIRNPQTLTEKRSSYSGSIVGAFRISELMANVNTQQFSSVKLYDVTNLPRDEQGQLISRPMGKAFFKSGTVVDQAATLRRTLSVGGRQWEFQLSMSSALLASKRTGSLINAVTLLGLLTSVVSALLVLSLVTSRNRALKRARRLSSELIQANNELEKSNEELSQFAYVASRDLQTPVRNMDMSVTLLEDALANRVNPQVRECLNNLHGAADRMSNLVDDLLTFACVSRETLQLVMIDLTVICDNASQRLATSVKQSKASIRTHELPMILGDQDQLEKLFVLLFSNAIKYRHPDRMPEIDISAQLADEHWLICVKDNGLGIDPAVRDKIFEPFQRLHRYEKISGTGLGLGICRQILECLDGSISLGESTSEGTSFIISLPAAKLIGKAA